MPNYRLIAFGVNQGPGAAPLKYAEKDAKDIHTLFTSEAGPVSDGALHLGADANSQSIQISLQVSAILQPEYFVFYFSGHGNSNGILLSDGLYGYDRLAYYLGQMDESSRSLVILDVCEAESFSHFLKEGSVFGLDALEDSWIEALASASPGSRVMYATGRDGKAREGQNGVMNGHFTGALLEALRTQRGDLQFSDTHFVSDASAFTRARRVMIERHGVGQTPVGRRLSGDLPLVVSQSDHWLGDASFVRTNLVPETGGIDIAFSVAGRCKLPTTIECVLLNAHHEEIFVDSTTKLAPTNDEQTYSGRVGLERKVLAKDPVTLIRRTLNGFAPLTWVLRLRDGAGDILDERLVPWRWFSRRPY